MGWILSNGGLLLIWIAGILTLPDGYDYLMKAMPFLKGPQAMTPDGPILRLAARAGRRARGEARDGGGDGRRARRGAQGPRGALRARLRRPEGGPGRGRSGARRHGRAHLRRPRGGVLPADDRRLTWRSGCSARTSTSAPSSRACAPAGPTSARSSSFTGLVRDPGGLEAMELEHYPGMTKKALEAIEAEARRRWPLGACLIITATVGSSPASEIMMVATASAHRRRPSRRPSS